MDTLQRAKNDLKQGWKTPNGATCACCGRKVKLYSRSISGQMTYALIKLVRLYQSDRGFHHISELVNAGNGGDFARWERYGLIIGKENEDSTKRTSGLWVPTIAGIDFVHGRTTVQSRILMYNNRVYGFEGKDVDVETALGKKFDYRELMGYLV